MPSVPSVPSEDDGDAADADDGEAGAEDGAVAEGEPADAADGAAGGAVADGDTAVDAVAVDGDADPAAPTAWAVQPVASATAAADSSALRTAPRRPAPLWITCVRRCMSAPPGWIVCP
ncbi:hypothetical protein BJP40_11390 [Streptomyces sp. CC53]|nr:hypothetical protein BJP40_11390 [Streptomyces sp. CC53]